MKCPIDGTPLVMTERYGVEIDYCPTCRGVWLDRGELDKIIERSQAHMQAAQAQPYQPEPFSQPKRHDQGYGQKPRKREGLGNFLEDIFDF